MAHDVVHVDRACHAGHLVQFPQVAWQVRIVGNAADIAFEMANVDGVEAKQGGEESPIRFGDDFANQVAAAW